MTNWIKNCEGEDSIIKLKNSSIEFNSKCEAFSKTCSSINAYQNVSIQIQLIKNAVKVVDVQIYPCSRKKFPDAAKIGMAMFGIPMKCPQPKNSNFCFKSGTKLAFLDEKAKRILSILLSDGKDILIRYIATHDTGSSCFEANIDSVFTKKISLSKH